MKYFYSFNDQSIGPVSIEELKGKISRETLVWHSGLANWEKASELPELLFLFQDIPPQLPKNIGIDNPPVIDVRLLKDKKSKIMPTTEVFFARQIKNIFKILLVSILIGILAFGFSGAFSSMQLGILSNDIKNYETEYYEFEKGDHYQGLNMTHEDSVAMQKHEEFAQTIKNIEYKARDLKCYQETSYGGFDKSNTLIKINEIISIKLDKALEVGLSVLIISFISLIFGMYFFKLNKWVEKRTK